MAKPAKKKLKMVYRVDLRVFHRIRRAQKNLKRMETRISSYRKQLHKMYKELIDSRGSVEVSS